MAFSHPQGETAGVVYVQERIQREMLSKCTENIKEELCRGLGSILSPVRKIILGFWQQYMVMEGNSNLFIGKSFLKTTNHICKVHREN